MRKSFTRLFSLVMFLMLFSSVVMAATGVTVWPKDDGGEAYSKPTDKIMIIFPEAVKAGTGFVRLYAGTSLERSISATDFRISYAKGDTVVIDFTADQEELVTYTVEVVDGTFKPVAAASDASVAYVSSWDFTVGDYTAPTLTDVIPVKDATVNQTISLEMTFADASNEIELGTGKVTVYKADGNVWDLIDVASPGDHSVDLTDGVLTIDGIRGLEDLTDYTVTIGAGVITDNGLRADEKKNAFAGLSDRTVWVFNSKDFSVPGFTTGYPKVGTVGNTTADILIKATEKGTAYAMFVANNAVQPSVATIKTVSASSGKVTIAAADTEYKISLTGLGVATSSEDFDVYVVTENSDVVATNDDVVKLEVTTKENVKPTLSAISYIKGDDETTTSPIDQATTKIVLDFNEKVSVGTGSIIIYNKADNTVFTTIDASAVSIDADDNTKANVTLSKVFANNASYYGFIASTLINDVFGNTYAGITTTSGWTFATNDIIAPTIVSYTPADGATGVAVDDEIVIKFSEVVNIPGDGTTDTDYFTLEVDGVQKPYSYAHSTNNNVFSTVTITPAAEFGSSSVVTITVNGDIKDIQNNIIGLTQGSSFVVEDTEGPTVEFVTDTDILPSTNIVVKFDEPVKLLGGTAITASNLFSIVTVKEGDIDGDNVSVTLAINADKTQITITPNTPWTSNMDYYVAISSSIEDASGNPCIDAITAREATYTVADVIPSTVDIDVDGATDVNIADDITISFLDENDDADAITKLFYDGIWNDYSAGGMANVIVFKVGDANGVNVPFSVAEASTGVFTVTPSAVLTGAKTYYIGIGASTKDGGGNVNAAKYATFTTLFTNAPTATLSPADDAIQVGKKVTPVITFNTDVELTVDATAYAALTTAEQVTINGVAVTFANLVVSGNTITIKHADWAANTPIEIVVPATLIQNVNAPNELFAGIAATEWNFATVDEAFATFTISPDADVTPALDDKLVITVAEEVKAGTGTISIKNADTDLTIEQVSSTASNVSIAYNEDDDETTIEITPSANFVYGGKYYVEVSQGAFVDMYANKMPAISGKTNTSTTVASWTFTAVDDDLEVVKVTPDYTENNAVGADIVVEFNRDIVKGTTGNIGFIETNFDEDVTKQTVSYGITSTNLVVSGKTLTIKHSDKPFTTNSTIFVTIEDLAIKAKTKTSSSITIVPTIPDADDAEYKFYVGDNLPPVATITPKWDAETKNYVAVNTNITIEFNEDVLSNNTGLALTNNNVTFGGGHVALMDGATPVDFQGTVSGRTITLDPTSNLGQSKTYTVVIPANVIKDTKTHVYAGTSVQFKTVDTTVPTVALTLTTTAAASINVTDITITDANPKSFYYVLQKESLPALTTVAEVKAGTKLDATSGVANFTVEDLDASTSYVLYYVVDDTFGNVTDVKTAKKSTYDTVAPLFVSSNPVNGTVDVDNAKVIVLTFNEDVVVTANATAKIYIKDKATNTIVKTLTGVSGNLANGATSKQITLTTGFSDAMTPIQVYIEMEAGLIKDVVTAGTANLFAGISGADKIYFTYEDNMAPSISKFNFTGKDATHVALNSNIEVLFSENVQAGAGNAILYKGTTPIEVFKGSEVAISGKVATINPTADFDPNSIYTLDVLAGFVKDVSTKKNTSEGDLFEFTTTIDVIPTVAANPDSFVDENKDQLETIDLTFDANVYLTIAGVKKSLVALTATDIKSKITFAKADGTAVPYTVADKDADVINLTVAADKLEDMASYVLTVSGFMSEAGLVMETTEFTYETGDGLAPIITFNPKDEAKNVIANLPLTITFSESVYSWVDGEDLFYIPFTNDNIDEVVYLWDQTAEAEVGFDATFNGTNKITITPDKSLISGHVYQYGIIEGENVTDIKSNTITGGDDGTWAMFTVLDTDKPKVVAIDDTTVFPEPDAVSVPADSDMWIKFNEPIVIGTGSITIRYEDGTIFESISGAGLSIDADDDMLLNISHKNFDSDAVYFVEIGEGVVTDEAGNKNVAITDPTKWVFTTKDTFELTANVTPIGENTPRTVSLTLSFNKAPLAQDDKFLAVYKEDGTAVYQKAVSDLTIVGKDAIYAGVALDADQAYYARVEAGAFKDLPGNTFAGIMDNSWVFSTVDNIAPKVVTLAPADNATGVDTQTSMLTMTFDRNIALGTGVISVRYVNSGLVFEDVNVSSTVVNGMTLTINLTKKLDAQTAFYVIVPVGAITNTEITKDSFAGILNTYTWNFTTATDLTAPKLVTWTPNATTITDNHPTLVMTFDEAVVLGAGNVKVVKKSDNVTALTIPVTAAMVSDKTVTVTYSVVAPAAGLDKNTDYYVLVDAGIVKDAAGNATAAVADVAAWTFKTGADFATPVVDPIDNSLEFKVYPNPFVDYVTVSNASELSKVVVSNIAGQTVKVVVNPENTIQLNVGSGVYFISLYQENVVVKTVKIVKR